MWYFPSKLEQQLAGDTERVKKWLLFLLWSPVVVGMKPCENSRAHAKSLQRCNEGTLKCVTTSTANTWLYKPHVTKVWVCPTCFRWNEPSEFVALRYDLEILICHLWVTNDVPRDLSCRFVKHACGAYCQKNLGAIMRAHIVLHGSECWNTELGGVVQEKRCRKERFSEACTPHFGILSSSRQVRLFPETVNFLETTPSLLQSENSLNFRIFMVPIRKWKLSPRHRRFLAQTEECCHAWVLPWAVLLKHNKIWSLFHGAAQTPLTRI